MAFDILKWALVTSNANSSAPFSGGLDTPNTVSAEQGAPSIFSYLTRTDDVAALQTPGYFAPVAGQLKVGDIILAFVVSGIFINTVLPIFTVVAVQKNTKPLDVIVLLTNAVSQFGVTNPSAISEDNELPIFVGTSGFEIEGSGVLINPTPLTSTHEAFMAEREVTLTPGLQLTGIGSIQFINGVGALYVDALTAMEFIDNDFGPDSQICTVITGELPSGGSTTPSALLELKSTTGVFLMSRMTTTQINALTSPANGSLVYDTTINKVKLRESGTWNVASDGSGTVTSLTAGSGISMSPGSPIVTSGTITNTGVLTVSGSASNISSTGGQNPVIDLVPTGVTAGTYTYVASLQTDLQGRILAISSGSAPVSGVLTVSGTAGRISSTGGANPVIDLVNTAVTPGSYTNLNATIGADGRITSASSGTDVVGITSISAGTGISCTPNPITTTGSISNTGILTTTGTASNISVTAGQNPVFNLIATGVSAGTYTNVASLQTDVMGRILAISSGGSAPSSAAKYIVQTVDGSLPNGQSLGALTGSGLIFNDITGVTGVLRKAIEGVDYPSVASVVTAQSTATTALATAVSALLDAAAASTAAAAASTLASSAQSTANTSLALGTALALAAYITQKPVAVLPFAQNLRDLGTGILKTNLTGSVPDQYGLLTLASAGTDFMDATPKVILQQANASAPNGQSLGVLTTGLMKNTVTGTTGVVSTALQGTDYAGPFSTFIVQEADSDLPNAQSLGTLTTGLVKNTVSGISGTLSTAVAGTDYATPTSVSNVAAATFITQTPSAFLSNEQALSALSTGIMKSTTATGVVSIAVAGTDYYAPNFPTVITDAAGASANFTIGVGSGALFAGGVTYTTAVGKNSMALSTSSIHTTALGNNAGAARVTYTNCTFLGDSADASVTALTNAAAIGYLASVSVGNAMVLGKNCNVGIAQSSPIYGLDMGTDTNVAPQIRMQSSSIPSAPPNANEGIFSVNNGRPRFVSASATTVYSGLIVAVISGGANATTGTATINGTTAVVVNTTAVTATSHIIVTRDNNAGAPTTTNAGNLAVGSKVAGTSFSFVSSNLFDAGAVRWTIINSA